MSMSHAQQINRVREDYFLHFSLNICEYGNVHKKCDSALYRASEKPI